MIRFSEPWIWVIQIKFGLVAMGEGRISGGGHDVGIRDDISRANGQSCQT